MPTHKGTQTIETSRLILRRACLEDAEPMFRNWHGYDYFHYRLLHGIHLPTSLFFFYKARAERCRKQQSHNDANHSQVFYDEHHRSKGSDGCKTGHVHKRSI